LLFSAICVVIVVVMYLIAALAIVLEMTIGLISAQPTVKHQTVLGDADTSTSSDQQSSDTTSQPQDQTSSDQPTNEPNNQRTTVTDTSSETQPTQDTTQITPQITSADTPVDTPKSENGISPTIINRDHQAIFQADTNTAITTLDSHVFANVTDQKTSEQVSSKIVDEVNQQENQLQESKTPEQKIELLTNFESHAIQNINNGVEKNQFSDATYAVQRLSDQIDKSADTIQQLPPDKANAYKNKLKSICQNTEYLLRPQQLVVPEETEQNFAITLGKCLNFTR